MKHIIMTRNNCTEEIPPFQNDGGQIYVNSNAAPDFNALYNAWEEAVRLKVKESTLANYKLKARKRILPHFGEMPIGSITNNDISIFTENLRAEQLSNKYISDVLVLLKTMLFFAEQHYGIPNPMNHFSMPRKSRHEMYILSASDQRILEQYIAEHPDLTTLGIAISKTTGLRIGELCALQWKDIDLSKRLLSVSKTMLRIQTPDEKQKTKLIITAPKSASSIRRIPLPACLIPMLRDFSAAPENYVISGRKAPIEPRTVQYRFARILKDAGLPNVNFHTLRHMFATNCMRLGFDMKALSELLGHSSVEITMKIYVHSSLEQKAEYMDRLTMAI